MHLYKVLVLVSLAPPSSPPVHWVGIPEWKPPLEPPLDIEEQWADSPKNLPETLRSPQEPALSTVCWMQPRSLNPLGLL